MGKKLVPVLLFCLWFFIGLGSLVLGQGLKWSFATGGRVQSSPAIAADGTIYVGSDDSRIYALHPDGSLKWSYKTGRGIPCTPVVGPGGVVYVISDQLYALEADGKLKWSYPVNAEWDFFGSAGLGPDGTIYVGSSYESKLYALNPDGSLKWSRVIDGPITSSVAIGADGVLYFGSLSGTLYAVRSDGFLKWEYPVGTRILSPAIGTDGRLYVATDKLFAFRTDGSLQWRCAIEDAEFLSSPALAADGTIYVNTGQVHAFNPDGTVKWTYEIGFGGRYSTPAVGADGVVYLGSDEGLYAFRPDGVLKWTFHTDGLVNSSPVVASDGTVYVGSNDGRLYAVKSASLGLAQSAWPMLGHGPARTGVSTTPAVRFPTLVFPQYANGETGGIRNRTRVVMRNNAAWEETGQIRFRDNSGNPAEVPIGGKKSSTLDFSIPPWGTLDLATEGTGTLQTGAVEVISDHGVLSRLEATEIFDILGHFVSIDGTAPRSSERFYATVTSDENTGIALYNPSRSEAEEVEIRLLDSGGVNQASGKVVLQPGQQVARFVDEPELFKTYFDGHPGPFKGVLELNLPKSQAAGAVGLIQKRSNGALMAVPSPDRMPRLKWALHVGVGGASGSSPAVGVDGNVYTAASSGQLCAIDPSGSVQWCQNTTSDITTPAAVGPDGTIYVGFYDGTVSAFGADGSPKWSFKTGQMINSSPAVAPDGTIYVGSFDHNVYAVNKDGGLKWSFPTGRFIPSSPAMGPDGTVYVASDQFYALRPDGTAKWVRPNPYGIPFQSSPAIGLDGTIYVGCRDRKLYAIDSQGSIKWSSDSGVDILWSPVLGSDGTIYVIAGKQLHAFRPDGSIRWSYSFPGLSGGAAAVSADGSIYVTCNDENLYVFSPEGKVLWTHPIEIVATQPAIGPDGTLYVANYVGRLYAFSTGTSAGMADSPWPMFGHDSSRTGHLSKTATLPTLAFPQYANGKVGGTANSTRVILRNSSSSTHSGQIRFQDNQGQPAVLPVGGQGKSTVEYQLKALGTAEVETDGTGALLTGAVEVVASGESGGLEGAEIFEILGHVVSLGNAPLRTTHQAYVTVTASENTGIAAYNPDRSEAVDLKIALVNQLGIQMAEQELELQPGQQLARFVDEAEMFKSYFTSHPGDFKGTLNVRAGEDHPVALIGLIQRRDTGALIAVASGPDLVWP